MARQLTAKQEKFCQLVASGTPYKTAYKTVYDCNSENTANVESVKLAKRDDIRHRIETLQKPIIDTIQVQAINDYDKKIVLLWDQIEKAKQDNDYNAVARFIDILNKMQGHYKQELQNDNEPDLETVDNTQLLQLIG